jgi:hypothetical protein
MDRAVWVALVPEVTAGELTGQRHRYPSPCYPGPGVGVGAGPTAAPLSGVGRPCRAVIEYLDPRPWAWLRPAL